MGFRGIDAPVDSILRGVIRRAIYGSDMGQLQFVQLQLNYNYIVFGQLQLQLHFYESGSITITITYRCS